MRAHMEWSKHKDPTMSVNQTLLRKIMGKATRKLYRSLYSNQINSK